ncbi:MAG: hypothetical protein IJX47_07930 [Clostridia bacterium]|nr:hypothetical protein [Clostridia bacterium]
MKKTSVFASARIAAALLLLAALFALLPVIGSFADGTVYNARACWLESESTEGVETFDQSYNGDSFFRFDATEPGQFCSFRLNFQTAGEYGIFLRYRSHESTGYADVYLDGEYLCEFDGNSGGANQVYTVHLGNAALSEGAHTLKFVITKPSTNAGDARKYYLNLFDFTLGDPQEEKEPVDNTYLPTVPLPEQGGTALAPGASTDRVQTYPMPACYSASTVYSLTVDGIEVPVYAYKNDYDYAEFSLKEGPVEVTVTVKESVRTASISPKKLELAGEKSGKTYTFTLEKDEYLILRINNLKRLVICCDPAETDVPDKTAKNVFYVLDDAYRADNTGKALSTGSLQKAIDDAAAYAEKNGGAGIVYVPAGVYRSGTLAIKSNVHLYLEGGAVIRATGDGDDYIPRGYKNSIGKPATQLIYTYNSKIYDPYHEAFDSPENNLTPTNIKIYGRGALDANGDVMENEGILMMTIGIFNADGVTVDGITCRDTNIWSVVPCYSEDLTFTNLKLLNSLGMHENDGIDINGCQNVVVKNSIGIALDDPYSTKTYAGGQELFEAVRDGATPCDEVLFEDCISWTICYGFKVGQGAFYDHKNITFRDCVVYDAAVGLGVHHKYGGAAFYGILFENIDIEALNNGPNDGHRTWVHIQCNTGSSVAGVDPVSDVTFRNINVRNKGTTGGKIVGSTNADYPEKTVRGIVFEDIYMPGSNAPAATLEQLDLQILENYTDLTVNNEAQENPDEPETVLSYLFGKTTNGGGDGWNPDNYSYPQMWAYAAKTEDVLSYGTLTVSESGQYQITLHARAQDGAGALKLRLVNGETVIELKETDLLEGIDGRHDANIGDYLLGSYEIPAGQYTVEALCTVDGALVLGELKLVSEASEVTPPETGEENPPATGGTEDGDPSASVTTAPSGNDQTPETDVAGDANDTDDDSDNSQSIIPIVILIAGAAVLIGGAVTAVLLRKKKQK